MKKILLASAATLALGGAAYADAYPEEGTFAEPVMDGDGSFWMAAGAGLLH